ncbi:adhesion G-protein coupled receptor G4-like [Pogona vitticeps]
MLETESLRGRQLLFMGLSNKYASLDNHHHLRDLCTFTVCIDLNKTEESIKTWAPFSYDVNSSSTEMEKVELALLVNKSILYAFILGNKTELGMDFPAYSMHRICCTWDGNKSLFEIFQNSEKLRSVRLYNSTRKCLKPDGTLILGHLHKNQNGSPTILSSFVGILHYFQMWDHVRDPQQMARCDGGNVVSWQGDYWSLGGVRNELAHHQPCGGEAATTAAPPSTSKPPEATVTGPEIRCGGVHHGSFAIHE